MRLKRSIVAVCASVPLLLVGLSYAIPCPWDTNNDNVVGVQDLLMLLEDWGQGASSPCDFNHDRVVNTADLLELLANWGPCPT